MAWTTALLLLAPSAQAATGSSTSTNHGKGSGVLGPGDSGLKRSAPAHNTAGAGYKRPAGTSHYPPVKKDPHAKRAKELTDQRTANASTWQMSDGSTQQEVSASPVHYRDAKGKWQDIDTVVKPLTHGAFTAGAEGNSFQTYFSPQAGSLVRLESGGASVQIGADGATAGAPKLSESTATYPGAWPNADLDYEVGSQGLKESIVLAKAPAAATTYSFTVSLGGGLTPKQNPDGSIGLFGTESANPAWTIPAPYMADAKADKNSPYGKVSSTKVTQSMTFDATTGTLHLTEAPDTDWLADGHRQYPVTIDPTIVVSPNNTDAANVMISADGPTSNYATSWRLSVGTTATGAARALIKFPMPSVPTGTTITSADLQMYYDQTFTTGVNTVPMQALQANAAWSPTTATWNNASSIAGPVAGTTQMTANALAVWDDFPVTSAVQNWINGSAANNGFVIKATNETPLGQGGPRFEGSLFAYNGETVNYPKLIINYGVPGVALSAPKVIHSTGAELSWPAYTNTTGNSANDIAEYQVHRSINQIFTPSASTEIAPVLSSQTSFVDSTAVPTPANNSDPYGNAYYYMVAVKTKGGQIITGPTQLVRLPEAGRTTLLIPSVAATTLSSTLPTTVLNTLSNAGTPEPWLEVGDNSGTYGITRSVLDFGQLPQVPANSQILDAHLKLWQETTSTNTSGAVYELHALTRSFIGSQATWNTAATGVNWTTAGGDFTTTADGTISGLTNDPNRQNFDATSIVQGWVSTAGTDHGLLVKQAVESGSKAPQERTIFAGPNTAEPALAPTLVVTYLDASTGATYYAPSTPGQMNPGTTYTEPVTINNTTNTTWAAAGEVLTYHWTLPDGTDVTAPGNQVQTALPSDLAPGATVTLNAQVTPPAVTDGNQQEGYTLAWDMYNKTTGVYLSAGAPSSPAGTVKTAAGTTATAAGTSGGVASLKQQTGVDATGNNQLGLEKFYQYTKMPTGDGTNLYVNDTGNTVWNDDMFSNPSRGFDTFLRLSYNSLDTYDTVTGFGWSIEASTPTRLGQPLKFFPPNGSPTAVVLDDGTGNGHQFNLNSTTGVWTAPPGVHLFLQHMDVCANRTTDSAAWTMTRPDGTVINYDCDGYPTAVIDANSNETDFEYQAQTTHGKVGKLLTSVNDPVFRNTLTLTYYAKGDASYQYIDSTGALQTGSNLTDPAIIDHVKSITDISGREVDFVYTTEGLLARVVDGAGDPAAKTFNFTYDATQGMKNVKLKAVQDPRGDSTKLQYYPTSAPFKWWTESVTDRLQNTTSFAYAQPSPVGGNTTQTTVTDANTHATVHQLDSNGRLVQSTDANTHTTSLAWDSDNNVTKLTEPNQAFTTWMYDPNTGYPLTMTDAVQNAATTPGTTTYGYVTYQGGHIAYLTDEVSASGYRHTHYTHDASGNTLTATAPDGMTTGTPSGYTTSYQYMGFGEVQTVTDANGNHTSFDNYDASGKPGKVTQQMGEVTTYAYGSRGETLTVTDPLRHTSSQNYDRFLRPTDSTVPKDQAGGVYITTPAPQYDANDNVVKSWSPVQALTTNVFDADDQLTSTTLPPDSSTSPARTESYTYDPVGNQLTKTEPLGNAAGAAPGTYQTATAYDVVNRPQTITDAKGGVTTIGYDNVGNKTQITDPRTNVTKYGYDLDHRQTSTTDADNDTTSVSYDADGVQMDSTAANNAKTVYTVDADARITQVLDPANRATKYLYDQVGNRTAVVSPLEVQALGNTAPTVDDPNTTKTVYDGDNRPTQQFGAFDPTAGYGLSQRPETDFHYDADSRVSWQSIAGGGATSQPGTSFTYFDNGWTKESVDPWFITTDYDYNNTGQQASRKVTSADGSGTRTMNWSYYPDGKTSAFTDSGLPLDWQSQQVGPRTDLLGDGASKTGAWTQSTSANGYQNSQPYTDAAGSAGDTFTWNLNITDGGGSGTYSVYVSYPQTAGASKAAQYTVNYPGGSTTVPIDQSNTANAGTMQLLGHFNFVVGDPASVVLKQSTDGAVSADTVKVVEDSTSPAPAPTSFAYSYDLNGNRTTITDNSGPAASFSSYTASFDQLDRMTAMQETTSTGAHTASYAYDPNSNITQQTFDSRSDSYSYDPANLVTIVTNQQSSSDPGITTGYDYTPLHERNSETKANGNVVAYGYNPDGSLASQVETAAGVVIDSHTPTYDADGRLATDAVVVRNADTANDMTRTMTYGYSPNNQVASVGTSDHSDDQQYGYNPDGTMTTQHVGTGPQTLMSYDRGRLKTIQYSTDGASYTSHDSNLYDTLGRLQTVLNTNSSSSNTMTAQYTYDSWDHLTTESKRVSATSAPFFQISSFIYDSLGRPTQVSTGPDLSTNLVDKFDYLGISPTLIHENDSGSTGVGSVTNGSTVVDKYYDYAPSGERLALVNKPANGTAAPSTDYYTYNLHSDVEGLSNSFGTNMVDTYGYSAYGADDTSMDSGFDKTSLAPATSDTQTPNIPDNPYRFNSARVDVSTSNYDMGFRTYNPATGQFISRDSYNSAGADAGLTGGTRYGFGGGNPISNVEMDGHSFLSALGGFFGGGTGVVAETACNAALDFETAGAGAVLCAAAGAAVGAATNTAADCTAQGDCSTAGFAKSTALGAVTGATFAGASRLFGGGAAAMEADAVGVDAAASEEAAAGDGAAAGGCSTTIGGESFSPDTQVQLADGSTKAISDLKPGDQVKSTDTATGKTKDSATSAVMVNHDTDLYDLTVHTAKGDQVIHTTQHHLFFDKTQKKWVEASKLLKGDELTTDDGTIVIVVGGAVPAKADGDMWDLTVPGDHDFYVMAGASSVLVHNCGGAIARHAKSCTCDNGMGEITGVSPVAGDTVVLGKVGPGERLAKSLVRGMTFNGDPYKYKPGGGSVPQWVLEVSRLVEKSSTSGINIAVDLGDLEASPGDTALDIFNAAANRGKVGWQNGPGTDWEMRQIQMASWDDPEIMNRIDWRLNGADVNGQMTGN